jgi:hypothetical protein
VNLPTLSGVGPAENMVASFPSEDFMDGFVQAKELVLHAGQQLERIRLLNNDCLAAKEIKTSFLIEIKNFMENLRSALDYAAHALFDKYGTSTKAKPRIYFPYAHLSRSLAAFRQEGRVEKCIPGLQARRPDIVAKIESFQHFGSYGNQLPIFMDLTNENKHQQLTPQVEKKFWGIHMQITIPPGGTAEIPIEPKALEQFVKEHSIPVATWQGFEFATNGSMVWPTLTCSHELIRKIVDELIAM